MRCFLLGLVALPLFISSLFSDTPSHLPSIPKNPALVVKEASPYPFLHNLRINKRLKKYLISVFKQTRCASYYGYNVAGNHIVLSRKTIKWMQRHTQVFHHPKPVRRGHKPYHTRGRFQTQIMVTRREVMAAARDHANAGLSTAALNMAHENRPGDNVYWGKQTEEAAIFRVTNYFLSLCPRLNPTLKKQLKNGKYSVPKFGGIYSPHVLIFRDNQDANFRYIAKPVEIAIIASVPYNMCHHSSQHSSPGSRGKYVRGTKEKMRAIFRIAAHKGHTAVVLSDYGCSERHNHPKVVSRLFRSVLLESEFRGVFKVVDFALPVAANTQLFLDFSRQLNGLEQ